MARYRDAAQRLVRSPWAHHCIRLLADALLRQGTIIWWFVRLSLLHPGKTIGRQPNPISHDVTIRLASAAPHTRPKWQ